MTDDTRAAVLVTVLDQLFQPLFILQRKSEMPTATKDGITLTHCGQQRRYGDSIYAGTVEAATEAEAKEKLAKMRGVKEILPAYDNVKWSSAHFTVFAKLEDGKWRFKIVEVWTD
jgi:hypothetical protein